MPFAKTDLTEQTDLAGHIESILGGSKASSHAGAVEGVGTVADLPAKEIESEAPDGGERNRA